MTLLTNTFYEKTMLNLRIVPALLLLASPLSCQPPVQKRKEVIGARRADVPYANKTSLKRASKLDIPYTVCIDPGHSKQTVGATGRHLHLQEYQVCWQMAKELEAALQNKGDTVFLTKEHQDTNIGNEERATIANDKQADIFLRLHCDSGSDRGIATFYPGRQGMIRGIRGPNTKIIQQSRRCAYAFHAALLKSLNGALHDRGVRTDAETAVGAKLGGALEGSIYSKVPVILVEMCVLDDRQDEVFIHSEAGRKKLAWTMAVAAQAAIKANRAVKHSIGR